MKTNFVLYTAINTGKAFEARTISNGSREDVYKVVVKNGYKVWQIKVNVPIYYMMTGFSINFYSDLKEASKIRTRGIDVFDYWVERVACVLGKFYGVDYLIPKRWYI